VVGAVDEFLARDTVAVERMTKRGLRTFDCRAAVASMVASGETVDGVECAILDVVVRHGTPVVRPDDILAGLRETAGLAAPVPPMQTRLAQGPLDPETGTVGDALDHDRDAASRAATAERSGNLVRPTTTEGVVEPPSRAPSMRDASGQRFPQA
jgi:hypothetical protein